MLFKSKFFCVLVTLVLALSVTMTAFADTIHLKDGSIIKGKIVNFNGGKFNIVIEDGTRQRQLSFAADEVESIIFDGDSMQPPTVKISNPTNPVKNDSGSTVITVGKSDKTTNPPSTTSTEIITPKTTPKTTNTPIESQKPIEINLKVLADNTTNGWTNSGWVVRKGQKIKITGSGRISLGNGRFSTPNGISSLPDTNKLLPNEATGALIAVIGDDNNAFVKIGNSNEFIATRDGALFLGVNEGNLEDNSGAFDVKIEIIPETGS